MMKTEYIEKDGCLQRDGVEHKEYAETCSTEVCQNLSGTGHCFDNARMESFFATLKKKSIRFPRTS